MTPSPRLTGGCQCGAIRYTCERLGRASICHCRMCQKAFGSYFGPYVDTFGLRFTRGAPAHFQSSNAVRRGFCRDCGTQLTFEWIDAAPGDAVGIAFGSFDDAQAIVPKIQVLADQKLPSFDTLASLPDMPYPGKAHFDAHTARVVSLQHPDHDTDHWPPT